MSGSGTEESECLEQLDEIQRSKDLGTIKLSLHLQNGGKYYIVRDVYIDEEG